MKTQHLIGGKWVGGERTLEVVDPATDEHVADVADAGEGEVRAAVDAAAGALEGWRGATAAERGRAIRRLYDLMVRDRERLAALMTREQGKPIGEARGEIDYAASFLEWASEEARRIEGEILPAGKGKRIFVLRQGVGVCAAITPWNFPSAMITRKLGPALAAGCTMVVKPAELTPLSALAIGELCQEAEIPAGVVNIVSTSTAQGFSDVVFGDPRVRKVSFTGSTEVGRKLIGMSAGNIVRLSLELGGQAPFLVFEDADLDAAVRGAVTGKFRNSGQSCISPNRFYVQRSVRERFVEGVAEELGRLRVGRGDGEDVQIGPLINDAAVEKVMGHIEDARERGARVVVGGALEKVEGCKDRFVQATLIDGLEGAMRISCEETFGPVIAVGSFSDEAEAIELANGTPYGLASYFYTRDAGRAVRVSEALEFGIVGVNDPVPSTAQAPFGGVKHSGIGREGGRYVMDEYLEVKYVSLGV